MGITYKIDAARNTVYITVSGTTDASDWIRCFSEFRDDELRKDGLNVLLDVRKHENVIDTRTVLSLMGMAPEHDKPIKWAFLVSRVVSVGIANMVSVHLKKKNVQVEVFENETEAEAWLQEK
jgi:hypothetical protein